MNTIFDFTSYDSFNTPQYQLFFSTVNSILADQTKNLSKGEKLILNNLAAFPEETFCEYNDNILILEEELLENEIQDLEDELKDLDSEIEKEKLLVKMEENECDQMSTQIPKLLSHTKINQAIFDRNYKNFETNILNTLLYRISLLYNNSMKIISEFDMNLKCVTNNNKIIVGYKKFDNFEYNDIMKSFEFIIDSFDQQYSELKNDNTNKNYSLPSNSEFDLDDFKNLLLKYDKLQAVKKESQKYALLTNINYKKEKYLNEYLDKYIKGNLKTFNDYKHQIKDKIENLLEITNSEIEEEFLNYKEHFCKVLFDNFLSKLNSREITFNSNFTELKRLLYSLAPYLTLDQNTTQEMFDCISELTEKFISHQICLAQSQTFMRKRQNAMPIENKITIDERDSVNLFVCNLLKPEIGNMTSSIYELKDLKHYLEENVSKIKKSNLLLNSNLSKFINDITTKIKMNYKILKLIEKDTYTIKTDTKPYQQALETIIDYKKDSYWILKQILNTLFTDLFYNEKTRFDLIDYLNVYINK